MLCLVTKLLIWIQMDHTIRWMATSTPNPKWELEEAIGEGLYLEEFTETIKIKELRHYI